MGESMPEVHGDHLDVSAAEERYLRRTFRRFALPWLVMAGALGALLGAVPRWIEATPESVGASEEPHLREQVGPLKGEVAALSQRVVGLEVALAKTREGLVQLEGRSSVSSNSSGFDSDELERRLDGFGDRIAALESGAGAADEPPVDAQRLDAQIAALAERLARIESEQSGSHEPPPADPYPQ
jgi:hypothetical protein